MTIKVFALIAVAGCFALGCQEPELSPSASTSSTPAAPAEPAQVDVAGLPGPPLPSIETPVTDVPRKFNSHDPIKGRRSRDTGGALGAVGGARFHIEYQTIINNIDYALKLYEAEHSEYPKSHEEFWQKIIVANGAAAKPPEIEPQHEYIYVPEQATVGLQLRLKPGGPGSKLPAPAPGKEHVLDVAALAAAGIQWPPSDEPGAEQAAASTTTSSSGGATDGGAAPAVDEGYSPNIREHAQQLGDQSNAQLEEQEHGVAPGGLAPVGGLGEGEF